MPSPSIPDVLSDQMAQLKAENERLRYALAEEIKALNHVAVCVVRGAACRACADAERTDWDVARALLEGKE